MTDARFVHIVDDVPELEGLSDGPVLVVALEGFLDAGNASALSIAHLASTDAGRVVASFEVDILSEVVAVVHPARSGQDVAAGLGLTVMVRP